jgi:hypothetical protein
MELTKLLVSQALLEEIASKPGIKILDEVALEFDDEGNLVRKGWW